MLSRIKLRSAIVGLAMLALPTAAFAGHHEGHFRSYGWHGRGGRWGEHWRGREDWHDHGWHNGWFRHGDDDDDGGWRYGGYPGWNENRGGWRNPGYGYGCGDDGDDCGRGGYGYAPPMAPFNSYPGRYNGYGYGGYPYGNTADAVGSLLGPLLGVR
jgi:hypothetical protein